MALSSCGSVEGEPWPATDDTPLEVPETALRAGSTAIVGHVDGLLTSNGRTTIDGWACLPHSDARVRIDRYADAPCGTPMNISGWASLSAGDDDAVNAACGSFAKAHRFSIPLPQTQATPVSSRGSRPLYPTGACAGSARHPHPYAF
jgi:hypothetical protein